MKDPLFNPIKIGNLEVKNRIYLPAMHLNMAEDTKLPKDWWNSMRKERAATWV